MKRAYRALAKRYHPDSAGEAATTRFLAIQAAYEALTDPRRTPRRQPGARPPAAPSLERGLGTGPRDARGVPDATDGLAGPGRLEPEARRVRTAGGRPRRPDRRGSTGVARRSAPAGGRPARLGRPATAASIERPAMAAGRQQFDQRDGRGDRRGTTASRPA